MRVALVFAQVAFPDHTAPIGNADTLQVGLVAFQAYTMGIEPIKQDGSFWILYILYNSTCHWEA